MIIKVGTCEDCGGKAVLQCPFCGSLELEEKIVSNEAYYRCKCGAYGSTDHDMEKEDMMKVFEDLMVV